MVDYSDLHHPPRYATPVEAEMLIGQTQLDMHVGERLSL